MALGFCSLLRKHFGWLQCLLYFLSFIIGFFICVPVGTVMRNFDGRCVLFAQLVWNNKYIYSWTESACDYVLYVSIALCMLYSTFMWLFTLFAYVIPRRNTPSDSDKLSLMQKRSSRWLTWSMNPVMLWINLLITAMVLALAVLITAGFAEFCQDLEVSMQELGFDFNSCYDAQKLDWSQIKVDGGFDSGARGGNFHICLTIATIASWILFSIWVLQSILNLSYTCRGFSCKKAAEKRKDTKTSTLIAARRSRMATPIGTPGHMTPRPAAPPAGQPLAQSQYGQPQYGQPAYGQPQFQPRYPPPQQQAYHPVKSSLPM